VEEESGLKLVHKTGSLDLAVKGTNGEDVLHFFEKAMESQNIRLELQDMQNKIQNLIIYDFIIIIYLPRCWYEQIQCSPGCPRDI
jgi:hypothetical protein